MKVMFNRKAIFTLGIMLFLMLAACEDILDRKPYDGLTKNEFWQNQDDVTAAVMGCYDQLQECLELFIIWGEARGDMIEVNRDNAKKDINAQIISQYNELVDWKSFYVLLNRANAVIENAPLAQSADDTFSEEELDAFIGECLFIRALSYFYLVRTFKEVPLILQSYATDDQEYFFPKTTSEEIYLQIIADLDRAESIINTSYGNVIEDHGRASRAAVNALKADCYLWLGLSDPSYYQKCVDETNKIINSNEFQLVDPSEWFSIYYPGNSTESIFELQYDAGLLEFNGLVDWFSTDGEAPTYLVRKDPITDKVSFWTEDIATEDAHRGRVRSYATVSGTDIVWKYAGGGSRVTQRRPESFSDGNWIFYRLPEVHLMKAEALNQIGDLEGSILEVNIVRQRIELPPLDASISSENLDLEILRERKRELAFEGKRWYDMMRFARITNPESWYLPIYYKELRINKSLVQNPYYDYE